MGKKLKITESQLKMLVENKNRKIVSEQPEDELNQNPIGELIYEFHPVSKDKYGILYLLRGKKSGEYGVFNKSKMDWEHGYQPSFKESGIKLYQTQNGDNELLLIAKYTGIGDKVFYTMQNVDSDDSMIDIVKFLNTREHAEVVKKLKDLDDDEPVDNGGFDEKYNDKVYEEGDMDNEMNESIQKIKSQFKRFL